MIRDSVEITEDIACDERDKVPVRYYSTKRKQYEEVQSCESDLMIICNVLADYAQLLAEYLKSKPSSLTPCGQHKYEYHRNRCLKIQKYLEEQTGYSREEAMERCRKQKKYERDIGEDAMVLSARKTSFVSEPINKEKE